MKIIQLTCALGVGLVASLHSAWAGGYGTPKPVFLPAFASHEYTEIKTGSSPDNSFQLFTELIESSRKEIRLGAYLLRSPGIAGALEQAARRGVKVKVFLDGWTVGRPKIDKIGKLELYFARQIVEAGGKVFYLRSDNGRRNDRRFTYLHAKYAVVDNSVFLSSENFSDSGFAPRSSLGNRGWVISIKNPSLAENFAAMFDEDISPTNEFTDIAPYGSSPDYTLADRKFRPGPEERDGRYRPGPGVEAKGMIKVERVLSPDDSLAPRRAILGAIRSAKETLDIQSLSFAPHWGKNEDSPESRPSPLAEAVLAAARRGVKVRVMLNPPDVFYKKPIVRDPDQDDDTDDFWQDIATAWEDFSLLHLPGALETAAAKSFKPDTRSNYALIRYFDKVAREERLDIEASLFSVADDSLKLLHNKGMVVDGRKTLISSINWTKNSMTNNRETAVIVDSPEVAGFYRGLFNDDWENFRRRY